MKIFTKKLLIVGMIVVLALSAVLLCACNDNRDYRYPRNGEPESGELYDLQTAYVNGWVSVKGLQNIAYYHDGYAQKKWFKPSPKNPETLSSETELAIKQAYYDKHCDDKERFTVDDVVLSAYYGTYDGLIAVMFNDRFHASWCMIVEELIGGVVFSHSDSFDLYLWKE